MLEMTDLTVIFWTLKSHWHLHFYAPVFVLFFFLNRKSTVLMKKQDHRLIGKPRKLPLLPVKQLSFQNPPSSVKHYLTIWWKYSQLHESRMSKMLPGKNLGLLPR